MKTRQVPCRLRPAALLVLWPAACSSDKMSPPAAPPVDWRAFDARTASDAAAAGPTAKERGAADAYVGALAATGFAPLASLLADDVHFAFPGMREARGREATVAAHDLLFGAFESRRFSADRIWRTATTQAVEWTMSATQTREWMGVKATGRPVGIKGVSLLWTRDEGNIADIHVYLDTAAVRAQLGAGPKGLAASFPLPVDAARPEIFDQTGSPDELADVSVTRDALDALERKNEGAYLSVMSDDVQIITPEHPRPLRGTDDLRGYFRAIHKSIGQLDTTVDNAWGVSRFALVEYSISGEQLGPIGWVPPQHDAVLRLHVVDIVELRKRLITSIMRYENPGELVSAR